MKIYNSLTQTKEDFIPIRSGKIGLYACGMTVYDQCHLGHARSLLAFDMMVRYLRYSGYEVNYVRNITDIDDKIITRANDKGEPWRALTERYIESMHDDEQELGILTPNHEPRATDFIPEIIQLIQQIIDNGYGYVAGNGDVCFEIARFEDYGKLSKRDIDSLISGVRVGVDAGKRHPLDFVLWKLAKPGEPHWESPWGDGRPGWHIECSAMSTQLLGQPFDIHGGGLDLKFPHHENEIAQSEAACGCNFANTWIHAGLLTINGEKMSKSLGNFMTIKDAIREYGAEEIRFFMLSGHYRSPLNFSRENLKQSRAALDRLYNSLRGLPSVPSPLETDEEGAFVKKMNDDFNTPEAVSILFNLSHEIHRTRQQSPDQAASLASLLKRLGGVLGILQRDPESYFRGELASTEIEEIERLISDRTMARQDKNWALADEIRSKLEAMGVMIEDTADGVKWKKNAP